MIEVKHVKKVFSTVRIAFLHFSAGPITIFPADFSPRIYKQLKT